MLGATLIGIFFIPLFFAAIRALSERRFWRRSHAPAPATNPDGGR
jgi:hypothetical protein